MSALLLAALAVGILLAVGPNKAAASYSQCPSNAVCVWSGTNGEGTFSWWKDAESGCHSHEGNPKIRSTWNRTNHGVTYGAVISLASGAQENVEKYNGYNPITGNICW